MITSYERPSLTSSATVTYNNQDIQFTFDLKGGTFDGLTSTPEINQSNYMFDNQILTVNQAFIESILNQYCPVKF